MKKTIFTLFFAVAVFASQAQITVFSDSPDNTKYPNSWGQGGVSLVGSNLPVTTVNHSGTNALFFQYSSGAYWIAQLFLTANLSSATNLEFWIYSETALSNTLLPKIHFQQNTGGNSTAKGIASYTTALAAGTWKKVTIPMADLKGGVTNNLADVKNLTFEQNAWTAGSSVNLIIDDVVINGVATGITKNTTETVQVRYSKGQITVDSSQGEAYIYDLTGKNIDKVDVENGTAKVNLSKGLYIVKTAKGAAKFMVY